MVSVDLDDSWAYLRTHGDPDWESAPSVLSVASGRLLELFDEFDLASTLFVVGRDATTTEGAEVIRGWLDRGHEVANHSMEHRYDLSGLSLAEMSADVGRSREAIAEVTGIAPIGFRCPSFGLGARLHRVIRSAGHGYDASLLPTMLGPVLRWYNDRSRKDGSGTSSESQEIFGPWSDRRLPLIPFEWSHDEFTLAEIPVTTVPLVRSPLHMSYLHAAAALSPAVARSYLTAGLALCRRFRLPVSFLIHPPDVLDQDDVPELAYLPGMSIEWRKKVDLVRTSLSRILEGRESRRHMDVIESVESLSSVDWARAGRESEAGEVSS